MKINDPWKIGDTKRPVNKKIVEYGSKIDLYEFEKAFYIGEQDKFIIDENKNIKGAYNNRNYKVDENGEIKEVRKKKMNYIYVGHGIPVSVVSKDDYELKMRNKAYKAKKAREHINRLCEENINLSDEKLKYVTITFKGHIDNIDESNKIMYQIIRKINKCFGKIEYVFVPDLHLTGGIHYHGVIFNMPYVDHTRLYKIINMPKFGSINIQCPKGAKTGKNENIKNIQYYITKILNHNNRKLKNEKLLKMMIGKKLYLRSKGLKKYTVKYISVDNEIDIEKELLYQNKYENKYKGDITYKQYLNV